MPRPLIVSLRKSGTHLVREFVRALGYSPFGEVFVDSGDLRVLSRQSVWQVARIVYPFDELAELTRSTDAVRVSAALRRALAAMNEIWRDRLGVPWVGGEMVEPETLMLADRVRARRQRMNFTDLPEEICWIVHQLPLDRVDGDVIRHWRSAGEPRIMLNHRDPRDVLLSMVEFLSDAGRGVGGFPEHLVYADILRRTPSLPDRLTIALADPGFPGVSSFEQAMWLVRHPQVCTISFEDLIGPEGGGSRARQIEAIARVLRALERDADPAVLADKLFSRSSFTFRAGRIGRWRQVFTSRHVELFEQRFGHVLDAYGYR